MPPLLGGPTTETGYLGPRRSPVSRKFYEGRTQVSFHDLGIVTVVENPQHLQEGAVLSIWHRYVVRGVAVIAMAQGCAR